MTELLQRLKQRKLVQWALAYVTAAFALIQVFDVVAQRFGWPEALERVLILALVVGFFVTLVLAWYHGERGAQKVTGTELLILALLLAIGGGLLWHFDKSPTPSALVASVATVKPPSTTLPAESIPAKSIAVLPFENLSSDKDNAYFSDGMQDLILTKLADIGDLKVISRTSTAKYASHPDDLKIIGQQLGVATILEGSVQKAGDEVLINVQLIDAKTDGHVWAQSYQRTLRNIFGVEGEVAQKVADALKARLTPPETQAVAVVPTRNPQAYDDYLRAQHFYNEATAKGAWTTGLPQAIAAYEKAVARDPAFALAWAGLSAARTYGYYFGVDRSADNLAAAEDEARRALTLAPDMAEAHIAMAQVYRFRQHDLNAARDEVLRALQLRPNDADAFLKLSWMESHLGHYDTSLQAGERAVALDPNDSFMALSLADGRAFVDDYAGAQQAVTRALAVDPQNGEAYALRSQIEILSTGNIDAAAKALDTMPAATPANLSVADQRIALLLYRRDFGAARTLAAALADQFGASALHAAMTRGDVEWLAGDRDRARAFYLAVADPMPLAGSPAGDFVSIALACARLGRAGAAIEAHDKAMAMFRQSNERTGETAAWVSLAKGQLALGHTAAAVDALAQVMRRPGHGIYLSPALLRVDPTWDPIRNDLGFQALLKKYADAAPAHASSGASHG
jgi:TolB-like protein/Tfp pilus assembly protein PilF